MQGSMGIEQMCQPAQVSRAGFYRSLQEQRPVQEEMEVRSHQPFSFFFWTCRSSIARPTDTSVYASSDIS